ncbi:PREDICTED: cytochrome P450 89A2-like [Nelumbo nucifera]|uniref:Cytochrome P450 89A2-like n=1 Tax=Nelumbo nucifera TaxID=4432 RepID=A0A1U8Q6G5_NELNU|nr:PREDICTED: cytochrome P450 89A2-like [Nelumbo nucifera]
MEIWFIILASLCISAALKSLLDLLSFNQKKLPPGPFTVPIIGNFLWIRKSFYDIEIILRNLRTKYGSIIKLQIGSRPSIFIANHELAHKALIHHGATFADRPPALAPNRVISSNQHSISSAAYGPLWRLFRRNLTHEILHPSRIKSYGNARVWVLEILTNKFREQANSGQPVCVMDHFRYAMFCLLVLMCYGEKLDEKIIKDVESVQRKMNTSFGRFSVLAYMPRLGKIVFRKKWNKLY